ncbi:transmembrane and tetratricopeptidecontaining 4 [Trypanosoma grayi]|uniref:transmembrane and tetratricopeptidecontaining 4 n=1 Tax=Trypanosoma grayi TaxID=71804 RepID=UPI0004F44530|nr:transmembrane and tetratricopeptidecontaining 4 [Trypanosoma grayi]KEG15428.1 transmembrane and tetratricopeptidecontaining 4 [Trypanosoma grayi]
MTDARTARNVTKHGPTASIDERRLPPPPSSSSLLMHLDKKDWYRIGAVMIIVIMVHAKCLSGELTFDDHLAILGNKDSYANSTTSVWNLLQNDYWGTKLDSVTANKSFRPLTVLTFRLQHWLSGLHHSAAMLRAVNIFISLLNGVWVYLLARVYLSASAPTGEWFHRIAPSLAMLLFAIHPVHIDAVVAVVGRAELLYCFFGFCAFFHLHRFLLLDTWGDVHSSAHSGINKRHRKRKRYPVKPAFMLLLVLFFTALSVLCKESGITFAALFVAHGWVMYMWGWTSARKVVITFAVSLLLVAGYVALRQWHIGAVDLSSNRMVRRTENPQYFVAPGIVNWLGIRWLIQVKNIELLFFPTQLCCEYSYNCIPPLDGLRDTRLPFMMMATGVGVALVYQKVRKFFLRRDAISLSWLTALMWLAVPYAPVSHLFVRVGTFIAERCLYVPSIGAVLLIVYTFAGVQPKQRATRFVGLSFLLVLGLFWLHVTFVRIDDWHNDVSLFRSAVRVCPGSGKSHYQLGAALLKNETSDIPLEVVGLMRKAYELDSEFKDPLYYLALYAIHADKDPKKAYALLRECVSSPFTMDLCYPLLDELRMFLFPNMTKWEKMRDNAALAPSLEEKAIMYRLAGISQVNQAGYACSATNDFKTSLSLWNASGIYWYGDRVRWGTDASFCKTLYYYLVSLANCTTALKDRGVLRTDAVVDAAVFIEHSIAHCDEHWHDTSPAKVEEDAKRATVFITVVATAYEVLMRHMLPPVSGDAAAVQLVRHAIAVAAVRRYCFLASLVNRETERGLLGRGKTATEARTFFFTNRASLLENIVDALYGLRLDSRDDDDDDGGLRRLSRCTPELASVSSRV